MSTDVLRHETFDSRIGETFKILANENETLDLELINVEVYDFPETYSFSVVFRGPSDRYVEQRLFNVEHSELGVVQMFLCPIVYQQGGPGIFYEYAVNNWLPEAEA